MNDAYEPTQRAIYRYHDGAKIVYADPLATLAREKMVALQMGKDVDKLIDQSRAKDAAKASDIELAQAWTALNDLAEISRQTFGLAEFNPETGEGADMAHALGVLNHFHLWLEKKNQTLASPSTSSQPESPSVDSPTQPTTVA